MPLPSHPVCRGGDEPTDTSSSASADAGHDQEDGDGKKGQLEARAEMPSEEVESSSEQEDFSEEEEDKKDLPLNVRRSKRDKRITERLRAFLNLNTYRGK